MNASVISPDDYRRAAAMLQHAARQDEVGMQIVVDEATEAGRLPHFIQAQALFAVSLFPVLASDYGHACINSYIEGVVANGI